MQESLVIHPSLWQGLVGQANKISSEIGNNIFGSMINWSVLGKYEAVKTTQNTNMHNALHKRHNICIVNTRPVDRMPPATPCLKSAQIYLLKNYSIFRAHTIFEYDTGNRKCTQIMTKAGITFWNRETLINHLTDNELGSTIEWNWFSQI